MTQPRKARHPDGQSTTKAAFLCGLIAGICGCELANHGDLAVTWRFNDSPLLEGNRPCAVMFAELDPPPAGLIRIELSGKTHFTDYVVCENKESDYPLSFYGSFAGDPPAVYARVLRDVPKGTYTMRVSFIDRHGAELNDPEPISRTVKISRDKTARIDLDFPLTYGRVNVAWSFIASSCSDATAVSTTIRLVGQTTGYDQETVFDCEAGSTNATPFTPVPPGTYRVEAQLLDSGGQPRSVVKEAAQEVQVQAAEVADTATVSFDATDLL
jgi:hypothetical protein